MIAIIRGYFSDWWSLAVDYMEIYCIFPSLKPIVFSFSDPVTRAGLVGRGAGRKEGPHSWKLCGDAVKPDRNIYGHFYCVHQEFIVGLLSKWQYLIFTGKVWLTHKFTHFCADWWTSCCMCEQVALFRFVMPKFSHQLHPWNPKDSITRTMLCRWANAVASSYPSHLVATSVKRVPELTLLCQVIHGIHELQVKGRSSETVWLNVVFNPQEHEADSFIRLQIPACLNQSAVVLIRLETNWSVAAFTYI